MKIFFDPNNEHLFNILQCALRSYKNHIRKLINITTDMCELQSLMELKTIINNSIDLAVKDPMAGPKLKIVCNKVETRIITDILSFYLAESKEIADTVQQFKINDQCSEDIEYLLNQIIPQ